MLEPIFGFYYSVPVLVQHPSILGRCLYTIIVHSMICIEKCFGFRWTLLVNPGNSLQNIPGHREYALSSEHRKVSIVMFPI